MTPNASQKKLRRLREQLKSAPFSEVVDPHIRSETITFATSPSLQPALAGPDLRRSGTLRSWTGSPAIFGRQESV